MWLRRLIDWWLYTNIHGVIHQKTWLSIHISVRTSTLQGERKVFVNHALSYLQSIICFRCHKLMKPVYYLHLYNILILFNPSGISFGIFCLLDLCFCSLLHFIPQITRHFVFISIFSFIFKEMYRKMLTNYYNFVIQMYTGPSKSTLTI